MHKWLLKKIVILGIILVALFNVSCGGGGGDAGGGNPAVIAGYAGLTTQARITTENAESVVMMAYTGMYGPTQSVVRGDLQRQPIDLPITLYAHNFLLDTILQVYPSDRGSRTIITVTDTINSTCPGQDGSASFSLQVNDETGEFSGTFDFNNYCEGGVTFSGSIRSSGRINLTSNFFEVLSLDFINLTMTMPGESYTLNGLLEDNLISTTTSELTMELLLTDNIYNLAFWVHDYILTLHAGIGYVEMHISGMFYDPLSGYVTLSTPVPFRSYDPDYAPSEGVLVASGSNGTSARMVVESNSLFRVEADCDGDGAYEWSSGSISWF